MIIKQMIGLGCARVTRVFVVLWKIFIIYFILIYSCVHVCACTCVQLFIKAGRRHQLSWSRGYHGGGHPTWVLGSKPWFSWRAAHALNHRAVSPDSVVLVTQPSMIKAYTARLSMFNNMQQKCIYDVCISQWKTKWSLQTGSKFE